MQLNNTSMVTGWSLGRSLPKIIWSCAMSCSTLDAGDASKDWGTPYKMIDRGSRSSFIVWAAWQFSFGRDVAWVWDGGAYMSECASISDSAGHRHVFFFSCLVRHGLGCVGGHWSVSVASGKTSSSAEILCSYSKDFFLGVCGMSASRKQIS